MRYVRLVPESVASFVAQRGGVLTIAVDTIMIG